MSYFCISYFQLNKNGNHLYPLSLTAIWRPAFRRTGAESSGIFEVIPRSLPIFCSGNLSC